MSKQKSWREIGKGKAAAERVKLRRERLEKLVRRKLVNISCFCLKAEKIEGRNLENMVGCTQVPLGVAGPVRVNSKDYYLPLATTEGALVASINRGCKAISKSGGAEVMVEEIGATRGPVFKVKGLGEGKKLREWLVKNMAEVRKTTEAGERHIKLVKIKPRMVGKSVYVRLEFKTDEAMGMNMATVATDKLRRLVKKRLGIECVSLSANYCVDKKPSWLNIIEGRGKQVWAEVVVRRRVVKEVLKTTPEKIVEVVQRKQWLGSMMSGSMGFNGQFANVVAAMFLATGQDMAQVVEGSLGITTAEMEDKDLYFSIYLPSLMVGTVGGGTGLATQKEGLGILGLDKVKKGDGLRLAEIIGGGVLGGELSLTAALASGDLAKAHQRLGRGK
jgi:hydroxymethylglutaryl-CoA reductase (NADPH)